MDFSEKQIKENIIFEGKVFRIRKDTVRTMDDNEVFREVVDHHGGVSIVPVDDEGNVYCVRQFRYPIMKEILELPAGKLEMGENPEECAVRELSEETGLEAESIVSLGSMIPTPGYCNEELHLYLATGLKQGEAHPDPGEFLSVEKIPLKTLVDKVYNNEIKDGKTIVGVLKAAKALENIK